MAQVFGESTFNEDVQIFGDSDFFGNVTFSRNAVFSNNVSFLRDINVLGNLNITGVITASSFRGDGSQLTGVAGIGTANINTNAINVSGVSTFSSSVSARIITGVSTAGITTIYTSSINDCPLAGFRNAIINGNFDIWQRGTTSNTWVSPVSSYYQADRWVANSSGTGGNGSLSQQTFTIGQTDVPNEIGRAHV